MRILLNKYKRKKIARCKVCKSIIRVSLEECSIYHFIDRSGYFEYSCPLCESTIRVKSF